MELFIFWLAFSFVAGIIASNKGRSGLGFFLLSILLSPILGILFALVAKSNIQFNGQPAPTPETHRKCPDCRELVLNDARVCKHCGAHLVPEAELKTCRKCHKENSSDKAVCAHCSAVL